MQAACATAHGGHAADYEPTLDLTRSPECAGYPTAAALQCMSATASKAHCCSSADCGADPSCGAIQPTSAACTDVLGDEGNGLCFAVSTECGSDPDPTSGGASVPFCPAMLSNAKALGGLKTACNAWAQANPLDYMQAAKEYCKTNPHHTACRCLAPQGTSWNGIPYDDMQEMMRSHGSDFPMECVWPPCMATVAPETVLQVHKGSDAQQCPAINNFCLNMLQDVHLSDITAGHVNIGDCINQGTRGSAGGVTNGVGSLPFSTQLRLWFEQNPTPLLVLVFLFVLVFAMSAFAVFKPPTALQEAEARMTLARIQRTRAEKEQVLIRSLRGSRNPTIARVGDMMATRQQNVGQQMRAQFEARVAALQGEIDALQGKAASSSQAAVEVAAMQTKQQLLRKREKQLSRLFT